MHILETKNHIPASLEDTWNFFSNPANLAEITPPEMDFKIKSISGSLIYPGMMISYRVKPLFGIPLTWVTEITHVKEKQYFVDEQRVGPYRLWHHQHHFRETEKGVEMHDIVNYALPAGILGIAMNHLLVRRKLQAIFHFRTSRIEEIFKGTAPGV